MVAVCRTLVCSGCSHFVEDEGRRFRLRSFQSKVGPLVGLLFDMRGWLPLALAWGPGVLVESSAGAERWWNAAFCWKKLLM